MVRFFAVSASDYTDIVALFTDKLAAERLATFIASLGVSCDVAEVTDYRRDFQPFALRYGVRVTRAQIDDLKKLLRLTTVAKYSDAPSAQVAAGRLARENIPCCVGTPMTFTYVWLQPVPTDESGSLGARTLLVPAEFVGAATKVLQEDVAEDALAKLALSYGFDPKNPP